MVFKKYRFCAFSLVELMISLITISLITAAFAPVITKKLTSSTITIGGSSGELTMDCSKFGASCGLCYSDKCVSCVKSCADNEALDVANCNCITCSSKYSDACLKCDIENCSKCTSVNYLDSGACIACEAGYYCDGTTKESCPQGYYCSDGISTACPAGTYNDLTGKSLLSDCKSCASNTYSTGGASSCANNTASNCSAKSTTSNTCTSCNAGYGYSNGTCSACTSGTYSAGGTATCVSNTAAGCSAKSTSSNKCTSCNAGYGYSSGTCTACTNGKYSTGGTMACTSVTSVSNCATYSTISNACTACNSGYKISNGQCVSQFTCSKQYDLLQIKADLGDGTKTYCITQKNIGDSDYYRLPNPSNVDYLYGVYEAKTGDNACKANYTTGCCWQGNTADGACDSTNGSYSGCNRTVCNWYAANGLCENLNILGQTGWRLPTQTELGNLNPDTYSKAGTSYAGDNGLMFCDYYANYNSARCTDVQVCPGSYDGACNPDHVWSGALDGSTNAFRRVLDRGRWVSGSYYRTNPFSVRCLKEL